MFDIKCKRKACVFNKNCNCTSKNITVNNKTECKTYEPSNNPNLNEVEQINQPAIRKDIKVNCTAKCLFNKDEYCLANGITVQTCDNKTCPNCCTYEPK